MKAVLQRKCGDAGCCEDCDKKKLQRSAIAPAPRYAPPIVHDVLRTSGQPLDGATRAAMEPRFGHDFSRVRVHRDARAAESAHAVGARAYTVGTDVVLGRNAGRDVIAHELAHVVQQDGAVGGGAIEIGRADDPLERQADHMAIAGSSRRVLRRLNYANGELISSEVDAASKAVAAATITVDADTLKREAAGPPGVRTSTFILHDTSSSVSAAGIKKQVAENRGPLGKGVTAWAPRDEAPTITRPFFQGARPTTTEHEKALEVFQDPADTKIDVEVLKARRDAQFRKIWSLVDPVFRPLLVELALSNSELTADELKTEIEGKGKQKGAVGQLDDPKGKEQIFTTATWAINLIAAFAQFTFFADILAVPGKEADLQAESAKLVPYFLLRNERVGSTNTVEIVQPGVTKAGAKAGHQNTCAQNNAFNQKFASPSYSDTQYNSVRDLYLRAAAQSRTFPYLTTHKVVDEKYGGHCDPRCFNLGRLYDDIAKVFGHPAGTSLYGVEPSYGVAKGKSVWWDEKKRAADPDNRICAEAKPK